jgi:hypothetical protein
MCPMHEKEWWARHHEALARHAADRAPPVKDSNLDLIGG